jgi:hypothetical protein
MILIITSIFKGLHLTAGHRRSNDFWLMVWEDWADKPREGYVELRQA